MQRGRRHHDVVGADRRIDVDLAVGHGLAHDLAVDSRLFGDEDDQVAVHIRFAGQPVALSPALRREELVLHSTARRDMLGRRCDAERFEEAVLDADLALAARALLSADRLDADAELAAGLEDRTTILDLSAPALTAGRRRCVWVQAPTVASPCPALACCSRTSARSRTVKASPLSLAPSDSMVMQYGHAVTSVLSAGADRLVGAQVVDALAFGLLEEDAPAAAAAAEGIGRGSEAAPRARRPGTDESASRGSW